MLQRPKFSAVNTAILCVVDAAEHVVVECAGRDIRRKLEQLGDRRDKETIESLFYLRFRWEWSPKLLITRHETHYCTSSFSWIAHSLTDIV